MEKEPGGRWGRSAEGPLLPPTLRAAFAVFAVVSLAGVGLLAAYTPPEAVWACDGWRNTPPCSEREPSPFGVPGAATLFTGVVGMALMVGTGIARRRSMRG